MKIVQSTSSAMCSKKGSQSSSSSFLNISATWAAVGYLETTVLAVEDARHVSNSAFSCCFHLPTVYAQHQPVELHGHTGHHVAQTSKCTLRSDIGIWFHSVAYRGRDWMENLKCDLECRTAGSGAGSRMRPLAWWDTTLALQRKTHLDWSVTAIMPSATSSSRRRDGFEWECGDVMDFFFSLLLQELRDGLLQLQDGII